MASPRRQACATMDSPAAEDATEEASSEIQLSADMQPGQTHRNQLTGQGDERAEQPSRIPQTVSEPVRVVLHDQMREMFAKVITNIDDQVLQVSRSQSELDQQLERLITTLDGIKVDEKLTAEIGSNARRISSLKSRLTLVHTILSNSSERCSRTLAGCGTTLNSLGQSASTSTTTRPTSSAAAATGANQ